MESEKKVKLVQRLLDERVITAEEAVELLQEVVQIKYVYPQPYQHPDIQLLGDMVLCDDNSTIAYPIINGHPVN